MNLQRTLEQYANCTASGVAGGSKAQMMYFVEDAKKDIAALAAALAAKDAELAKLREEKERLRIDASNHAADAETVRRERDALIREKERLRNALGRCRTAHCGYNLSGSYEEAAGVVSAFYAELSRIDEVVRAALAGGVDASPV